MSLLSDLKKFGVSLCRPLNALSGFSWWRELLSWQWGEKSLVALSISILSGLLMSLQFDQHDPYYSVAAVEILVPFGPVIRSLHFYSSQIFFILSLVHFLIVVVRQDHTISLRIWLRMVASVPVVFLLMLTGYILRADSIGEHVGTIAEQVTLSVPFFGIFLNNMLFAVAKNNVRIVYVQHMFGLGLLWGILSWQHLKRYQILWRQNAMLIVGLLVFCLFVRAPHAIYGQVDTVSVGPWFFWGLQELLRYLSPFAAGIVFPLFLLVSLLLIRVEEVHKRWAFMSVCLWLIVYAFLSTVQFARYLGVVAMPAL